MPIYMINGDETAQRHQTDISPAYSTTGILIAQRRRKSVYTATYAVYHMQRRFALTRAAVRCHFPLCAWGDSTWKSYRIELPEKCTPEINTKID